MASNESRQTDPLQDLFADINRIIEFIEIKDANEARKYETNEISENATMWMNAVSENDTYLTYRKYWTTGMFQDILPNVLYNNVRYFMSHPYNVPIDFRDNLLKKSREIFLSQYQEENDYYRMLMGLPSVNTPKSEYIYLSEPMRNQLHASDLPVHELSDLIQNSWMATEDYQKVLANNPDKKYLKYLGLYKIDGYTARKAKDFEIIRYPSNRADINPYLLKEFASLYDDYREYVTVTLYNEQFENIYKNYRNFMGLLIIMFVLMHISDKGLEAINARTFLDDSVIHILLSMYGIPNRMLMTKEVRRELAVSLLQLTRNKGTNKVYYDLVRILGYQEVIISKLMLMKGQKFDSKYNATNEIDPYFLQLDILDKNPYETITNGKAIRHDYHAIVDGDSSWWDLNDVKKILLESNYSVTDSKYIMIEAIVYQMRYMFESIYFARMILDNKTATDTFMVEIPELFGTELISIYDLMLFVISAMCMNNGLKGNIINEESGLLATAGFNFDLDYDNFIEYLSTCRYADVDKVKKFMENLTMIDPTDVSRLYNDVMYPMREWLEQKIANSTNRYEYVEYESIYRAFYTYDINHNTFLSGFQMPIEVIREKYNLSEEDMQAYKHFYPHQISGERITIEEYGDSRYNTPFLSRTNLIDYYIKIVIDGPRGGEDRGELYFYDILNCDDVKELDDGKGFRVFMDYIDEDNGWVINQKAVNRALELIDKLDENALFRAYFQVNTPVLGTDKVYQEGEMLPASIRAGIYKEILREKILMDISGLCKPAVTYQEYLYRKNQKLHQLLMGNRRFELDHEAWLDDVMKIVLTLETELDVHMKYFEQAVVGSEQFFYPLIELIKRFKSTYVQFAKTGLRYIIADKIDAGGNSNMFKLFDDVEFIIHFVTLANREYLARFGLYDTIHKTKYHIKINDRSLILKEGINSYTTKVRDAHDGSLRLVDEAKFYLNGKAIDPSGQDSSWFSGEPGTGRWSEEDDILMRSRRGSVRVTNTPVDFNSWKNYR